MLLPSAPLPVLQHGSHDRPPTTLPAQDGARAGVLQTGGQSAIYLLDTVTQAHQDQATVSTPVYSQVNIRLVVNSSWSDAQRLTLVTVSGQCRLETGYLTLRLTDHYHNTEESLTLHALAWV